MDAAPVLRDMLIAANRQDLDAVVEYVAPNFIGEVPSDMSAEPDFYRGHDGIRHYFESFWEIVEDLHWEMHGSVQCRQWTLALGRMFGSGRGSGLPIDRDVVLACQASDGKLTRMIAFPDLETAQAVLQQ